MNRFVCRGLYIDGRWVEPASDATDPVLNPATEISIADAPVGSASDAERAVTAARRAFDDGPWPRMTPRERSDLLYAFHAALDRRRAELTELIVAEAGATTGLARDVHVGVSLDHLAFFAEMARREWHRPLPPTVSSSRFSVQWSPARGPADRRILGAAVARREPVGVVTAITPFNFPFYLNLQKLGPALAMGNTIVLKPSPFTPLQAFVLAEAAEEAGLPAGVVNVVTGDTPVGLLLTTDPRVDMVTFTGSDAVGQRVMAQAASTVKRVLLELGGKSALIARADADLGRVVAAGSKQITTQAGQGCALCTRHVVHRSLFDEYVAQLAKTVEGMSVGDPADPGTDMGPLIREAHRARVHAYVTDAVAQGATLITGGRLLSDQQRGFFYPPTVLTKVQRSSAICQEEIFGPVAVVLSFTDDREAVEIANDSRYGLSGQIFSADSGAAFDMATQIRTGVVHINGGSGTPSPWDPFGGMKQSGIGRELGEDGLAEYSELKTIKFNAG